MRGRIVCGLAVAAVVALAGDASAFCFLKHRGGGCYGGGGGCYGGQAYASGGCYGGHAHSGYGAGMYHAGGSPYYGSAMGPTYTYGTAQTSPYYQTPGVVATGSTTTSPSTTGVPTHYQPTVLGTGVTQGVYNPSVSGTTMMPAGYSSSMTASGSMYWNGSAWAPMAGSNSYVMPGYSGGYSSYPSYGGYSGNRGYSGGRGFGFGGRFR